MPAEGRPPVCTGCSFTCRWADREKHFSKSQISGRKANPEAARAEAARGEAEAAMQKATAAEAAQELEVG